MKESGNCVTSQQQHIKENIETFKLSLNPSFYYDDNSKQDVKSPKPKKKQNREPISKRISGVYQHFPIPDNDQMPLLTENTSHEKICSTKNVISNTYDSQFGILKNICSFDSNEYSISKDQISTLLTWTKCSNLKIFFDTKECGWNRDSLNNALLNKLNIVLLHYTTDNDIFGVYIHNNIKQTDEWVNDENHFIFSFSNNNRSLTPKRWKCSTPLHSIYLSSKGTHFYQLGNGLLGSFIKIQSTQSYNESFIATGIYSHYFGLSDEILTGNSGTFTINRIVVMQLID
ncbi:TLDc domain-containing protein [Entamoeba marina]